MIQHYALSLYALTCALLDCCCHVRFGRCLFPVLQFYRFDITLVVCFCDSCFEETTNKSNTLKQKHMFPASVFAVLANTAFRRAFRTLRQLKDYVFRFLGPRLRWTPRSRLGGGRRESPRRPIICFIIIVNVWVLLAIISIIVICIAIIVTIASSIITMMLLLLLLLLGRRAGGPRGRAAASAPRPGRLYAQSPY